MAATHTLPQRRSRRRFSGPLILIMMGLGVLLLIIGLVVLTGDGVSSSYDFTLPVLNGDEASLSDYNGQVVLVNFWATWCPPCKAEMPMLDAYYQAHKEQGFVMLAVNVNEPVSLAASFIDQTGYSFPVLLDATGDVSAQYGVSGMPTSVVFNADGEVVYRHSGMLSQEVLEIQVTPLLK